MKRGRMRLADNPQLKERLFRALANVVDIYDDFYLGTWVFARDEEEVETIIEFVKQNSDATTSEIIDFMIWYEDRLDGE